MIRAERPQDLAGLIGVSGTGDWVEIDQQRITAFADVTEDHQWIHVDEQRAARGPYGTTIAHGLLTLSLVPRLIQGLLDVGAVEAVVNYGVERVRFLSPVPRGSRLRAQSELAEATTRSNGVLIRLKNTIELEGAERPALVAETLHLFVPAQQS